MIVSPGPVRLLPVALLLLLGACATPRGSSPSLPTVIVAVVGLEERDLGGADPGASSLPHLARAARSAVRWSDAIASAPGLTAVTSLLSTEPNESPLPPSRLCTPGGRPLHWLSVAPRLASRPEARRLVDPEAVGRSWPLPPHGGSGLYVAVFDPLSGASDEERPLRWRDFDERLHRWRAEVEGELGAVRWCVAAVAPPPAEGGHRGSPTPAPRPLLWIAPDVAPAEHAQPVLLDDLPAALEDGGPAPRLPTRPRRIFRWAGRDGGEVLRESIDGRSWEVVPPPERELEVWVQGDEEVSLIDLRVEASGGILEVEPIDLEDIDDVLRPDAATARLQLATGIQGDGARLRLRRPDAWLRLRLPGRMGGTGLLGTPFRAGPGGQGLGHVEVELAPLSRDWWRCRSEEPPDAAERRKHPVGVSLWLLPPGSAGE